MKCPKCGAETEVLRKCGVYRQRLCKSPKCALEFETRENLITGIEFRRADTARKHLEDSERKIFRTGRENLHSAS
jgi:hypothetical protein